MDAMKTEGTFNAATALYFDFLEPTLSSKLPTSVDVKKLIQEYKKFLVIKVVSKDTQCPVILLPSSLIGQVLTENILNTA